MLRQEKIYLLSKLRDLIPTPSKWTKYALARDSKGRKTLSYGPDAVRFCLFGGVEHLTCAHHLENQVTEYYLTLALKELYPKYNYWGLEAFNDNWRTHHKQVLEVIERAIQIAEATATDDPT